ncbi:MAG: ASCH domain-containing protein [Pseudomonadota bacterium]
MSTSSQEKIEDLRKRYPGAEVFRFGDGPQLCAELLALVISGKKTATCGALRDFEAGGEAMPHVGRHDIALHWTGEPAVVIETKSIEQRRFCDVTEAFALAEGENDSLEGWRQDHETYFARNGGFDPEMVLVCERFEVVEVVNA